MPDLIDFEEALKRTDGEDRALLIGNGFSTEYFGCRNLLDKSGFVAETMIRDPFDTSATVKCMPLSRLRYLFGILSRHARVADVCYGDDKGASYQ
jgi:hypothetical protein